MSASSFVLELLDSDSGHVLHTWELGGSDALQLGRSGDNDVVLSSPFVSRIHACLHPHGDGWELSAVSRGGVFVEGTRVDHLRLEDGLTFRLAERGPFLRFWSGQESGRRSGGETICFDSSHTPLLVLDEQLRDREVTEIAEGDYFQALQRKVASLRSRPAARQQNSAEKRD